jgi:type II secretory pathway component PulF
VVLLFRSPLAPSLPGLRKLREGRALSRAAIALSHVWSAGLDPRRAFREAADAAGEPRTARAMRAGAERVARGAGLAAAAEGLPAPFVAFLRTGERTGEVDESMRDAHRYYEDEFTHRLEIVLGWLKWIVFLVAAGWAGWWIVTRFLAFTRGEIA